VVTTVVLAFMGGRWSMADEEKGQKEEKKEEPKKEEQAKSIDEILESVPPGSKRNDARSWLEKQIGLADQWGKVQSGEEFDQQLLKEAPRTEFHSLGAMENVTGKVDQIGVYNQARELAESRGEPGLMDAYVPLLMAHEMISRFRDGRLVLMGVNPVTGPILAGTGSEAFRAKQDANKKVK
jgi:hypothetical protein